MGLRPGNKTGFRENRPLSLSSSPARSSEAPRDSAPPETNCPLMGRGRKSPSLKSYQGGQQLVPDWRMSLKSLFYWDRRWDRRPVRYRGKGGAGPTRPVFSDRSFRRSFLCPLHYRAGLSPQDRSGTWRAGLTSWEWPFRDLETRCWLAQAPGRGFGSPPSTETRADCPGMRK